MSGFGFVDLGFRVYIGFRVYCSGFIRFRVRFRAERRNPTEFEPSGAADSPSPPPPVAKACQAKGLRSSKKSRV